MNKKELTNLLKQGSAESRLKSLLEELDSPSEKIDPRKNVHTSEDTDNVSVANDNIYSSDQHTQKTDVEGVLVEGKKLSHKEKLLFLLEKYGVDSMKELFGPARTQFLNELNDPDFTVETTILNEDQPTSAELMQKRQQTEVEAQKAQAAKDRAEAAKVDAERRQGTALAKNNTGSAGPSTASHLKDDVTYEDDAPVEDPLEIEKPESEPKEPVVPSEEETDSIEVNEDKEKLEPPVMAPEEPEDYDDMEMDEVAEKDAETNVDVMEDSEEGDDNMKAKENIEESLESIFDILRGSNLSESVEGDTDLGEVAAEPVHDDSEATEHTPEAGNEDVYTDEDHEQAEDVEGVVVEGVEGETDLGDAAAEPVHDDAEATEHTPEKETEDVFPEGEHEQAEDVEGVVVEGVEGDTDLGEVAAEPVHDDSEATEHTPEKETEDVFPEGEHEQAEDVEGIVVESEDTETTEDDNNKESEKSDTESTEDEDEDEDESTEESTEDEDEEESEELNEEETTEEDESTDEESDEDEKTTDEESDEDEETTDEKTTDEESDEDEEDESTEMEVSNESVRITIPVSKKESIVESFTDEERAVIQESLKVIYNVFLGNALNEEESVEIPEDAEADVKVHTDKLVVEIPVEAPKEELDKEELESVQEAIQALNIIFKESVEGETDLGEVAAEPVHDDAEATEHTPEKETEDVYTDEDHEQAEDVEGIVVESEETPPVSGSEVSEEEAKSVKPVEVVDAEGEVVEVAPEHHTEVVDGEAKLQDFDHASEEGKEVRDALHEDEHEPKTAEEIAKGSHVVHSEVVDGKVRPEDHDHADEEGKEVRDEVIEESVEGETDLGDAAAEPVHDDAEAAEHTPEKETEDVFPEGEHEQAEDVEGIVVESDDPETPETEGDKEEYRAKYDQLLKDYGVKDVGELTDEQQKEFHNKLDELHVSDEEEKEALEEMEVNDAGTDTVDETGEIEDPESMEEGPTPEDLLVDYKSLKEAFLLQEDYFDKDGYRKVSAEDKKSKLAEQLTLLVARDSGDSLYEELVKTTVLAKNLQSKLIEKYNEVGKEKAQEIIDLKKKK